MYGPHVAILLMYRSHDMRHNIAQVDGLSMDTPVLGRHT